MKRRDFDVIVVGAGAAGLAAALCAAERNARVLLLDAGAEVGGSSRLSGGHVYAAGTRVQREAGVSDSADAMFEHYMTLNQWLVEPSVVRRYCDASAETLEWLQELGVIFETARLYVSGTGSVPRGHAPEGEGLAVVRALDRERAARGVDLVLKTRVEALLTGSSGEVRGVRAGGESIEAGAVVLASGGFGNNPELLAQHFPDAAAAGDWSWYIGAPEAQGDGIALGQGVGAALDGHNRGLLLVTPGFSQDLEIFLPAWLVLVARSGRRFASETTPYSMLAGLVKQQGRVAFAIFDESARAAAAPSLLNRAYWVDEILQRRAEEGHIARADTLMALAQQAGIDGEALVGTVERYNADCDRGADSAFFKQPASEMRKVDTPPFYAVEVRPNVIAWTGAGLRIDAETRVIGRDERPIAGLYAAGETVGSLHGDRYIGGGGSFGPCLVFGRIAGEQAAHHALEA